jgi:outer membrane protein assembly factor BamB
MSRSAAVGVVLSLLVVAGAAFAIDVYSPGGWATLHRGPANRKLVPESVLASRYRTWTALEGAAVLTAPTVSPDGGTLYVTTGRAAGHSNLHAFDRQGRLRWSAPPWQDATHGIDPCAVLSSPIVDVRGDVFVGDCNQLFAFHGDGRPKWVVDLPPARSDERVLSETLAVNALTTAVFTREGHVLGVTNFGDVVVVDREDGRRLADPLRLPGRLPARSTTVPMPSSVFGEGLLDPQIRDWAWQLLFGGAMRSTNTPAVDLESGRVFVAATSTTEGRGALYALDLRPRGDAVDVEIAFAAEIGPGSGSSPTLSPSRDRVYVSDEDGMFYAIDARSGAVRWQVQTKSTSAAAAVGANGDVYSLQAYGPALVAIAEDGRVRWQSDLEALARDALPESWLLGPPVAIGNGNPTVVGDVVLLPVAWGYETTLLRRIPWLVESWLVAIDARTGRGVRGVVRLADDSTGITAVLPDGTIVSSLGTAITSGLSPLAGIASWLLPDGLELLRPVGGIQVSLPRDDVR